MTCSPFNGATSDERVDAPQCEHLHWPFLQVQVAVDENDFDVWARVDFAIDHRGVPKGAVEIRL